MQPSDHWGKEQIGFVWSFSSVPINYATVTAWTQCTSGQWNQAQVLAEIKTNKAMENKGREFIVDQISEMFFYGDRD